MAQIPKGRLVKGSYKPRCRDCDIYFSSTVHREYYKRKLVDGFNPFEKYARQTGSFP